MKTVLPILLTLLVMQFMMWLPKPEFYHKFQHYVANLVEKSDYGLLIGLSAFLVFIAMYFAMCFVIYSFFKHFINNL
jgi:hypothetical protein